MKILYLFLLSGSILKASTFTTTPNNENFGVKSIKFEVYNIHGKKLGGERNKNTGKVVIIKNRKTLKTIRQFKKLGFIPDTVNFNNEIITTEAVLREILNVCRRTQENGGEYEETSIVFNDGSFIRGKTGSRSTFNRKVATAQIKIAKFPPNKNNADVTAQIHSHPTRMAVNGSQIYPYTALTLSPADQLAFCQFKVNIIVGALDKVTMISDNTESLLSTEERPLGAVFYNRFGTKTGMVRMEAIEKILKSGM